jgi:hypothetical protein
MDDIALIPHSGLKKSVQAVAVRERALLAHGQNINGKNL